MTKQPWNSESSRPAGITPFSLPNTALTLHAIPYDILYTFLGTEQSCAGTALHSSPIPSTSAVKFL